MFAIAPTTTGSNFRALDTIPVSTIAILKSLTGMRNGQQAMVSGYYSAGDGGGGEFYWDAASSATDNGGTVIAADAGGVGRWKRLFSGGLNVKWFGVKGDGSNDDTAELQAAISALTETQRQVFFPPGNYLVSSTLLPAAGLTCAEFIGAGGYDGLRGPINDSLRTRITWNGATSATTAVVKFDRANGVIWRGISINCNYKAGYGLQFYSSTLADPSTKNIVENCSIHYATADGIIVGQDGNPTASPGQRQFFGNVFRNLTLFGCARTAIHINEWNADQQTFDTVMVYPDDAASPQNTLNGFWFDHGGQQSILINCQCAAMNVVVGQTGSGFAIKNKAVDSSPFATTGGAFGLTVINFWSESVNGGLYYGVTSTNGDKQFLFINCRAFMTVPGSNRACYVSKGTASQIPYTFINCQFDSDIEIPSATFNKESLSLINCRMAAGHHVLDLYPNNVTIQGMFTSTTVTANTLVFPRFANVMKQTLTANVNAFFAEGITKEGDEITVIVTQDGTGGRTLNWAGSGQFSAQPAIPAPAAGANAITTYTFKSDGALYYMV